MKIKFLLAAVAGILAGVSLSAAPVALAATPTFSLSGVGSDSVQISVTGDPGASAVLFYNIGSALGAQVSILGTTDSTGHITKTVSVSSLGLSTSNSVYVVVNSQQSTTVPWTNTTSSGSTTTTTTATTSSLAFDQNNLVIAIGGTATVNITIGGSGYYVSGNSNPGLTSTLINDSVVTISGLANGSTAVTICSLANVCGIINVSVGSSGTVAQVVSFSPTNPALTIGQTFNVALSGATSYFLSTNSNSGVVQASISGSTLTISGLAAGSASLSVCANSGGCSTLAVTVAGAASTSGTVTTTPAAINLGNAATTLATIQTMQSQLAQMLLAIQAMQTQLAQIVASIGNTVSSAAVAAQSGASSSTFTLFLKLDSSGSEVIALQKKLAKEGFYSGPITGYFGPLTESAVRKYQMKYGLEAAGYIGPSTRAVLNGQ